ncbi:hypothetical protein FOYG_17439 [Fusarium oxysporum NRRL 32931]|uniref:Uncharacterized protein n=1 Tax=Fusarium oxysporum NRRL 32931 TaxID=660029 RepID=W9HGS5_FUSOX|nr:hypothetical protein FOYG_17439 [Fusarium oxysporum NRRL 32931]EWY79392.1 hypothetical protein FOYG_17439 [Fusarium oxysporum NRRL 32931]
MQCLDIPVPCCVQKLIFEPPVRLPNLQDIKAVNLIRNFGNEFGRRSDEIDQACNLASGPSDMVILLERPHKSQTYHGTFGEFVKRCKTLKSVDKLIRFSSKGARSIHTVTVLDAFSFKPEDSTPIPSERCHQLIEEILKLKKPKVVLCCWNQPCEQPFVAQFKSHGVGTWPFRHQVDIEGFSTIAIRSFHPAAAVCYDESRKACCRMLLICHFVLAFAQLAGSAAVPEWMETICKNSSTEYSGSQRNGLSNLVSLTKTPIILNILRKMMEIKIRRTVYPHSEGRRAEDQRQQVNALLRRLFASGYNKGAQDITKLCLLWRDYKYYEPSTRQDILNRLIELGSQQNLYQGQGAVSAFSPARKSYYVGFVDDEDDADLEKQLASLNVSENRSSVDDEIMALARLQRRLSHQKNLLQRIEDAVTEVSSHIQLSIKLQITIFSHDRTDLSKIIVEQAKDMYRYLEEVTAFIMASPAVLAGDEGLVHHEEQPKRSLAQRPDARRIMDSVILDLEILSNQAFRCILLYSGLIAQGRILFSPSQDSNDDVLQTLFDAPRNLRDKTAGIKSALDTLMVLREQLNNPNHLFKRENHVKLPYEDKGVSALYK